jgi:hypothetical protein
MLWIFIDGPEHLKSMEPMVELMFQQIEEMTF